jgi:NADPH2:quinone reductase
MGWLIVDRRLSTKNVKLLRPTLDNYIATREEFEHYAKELFDFILVDKVNIKVHEVYSLEEVARAHIVSNLLLVEMPWLRANNVQKDLTGRKTTGKLLLKP